MQGMNAQTGRALAGLDHLRQSVNDILTTYVGSRVERRVYGSRLFAKVDAPGTSATLIGLYADVAEALTQWEPRFRVRRVRHTGVTAAGRALLNIEGEYLVDGRTITLDGIVI
ncbi:MAG: hypothetical protein GKR94_18320 [Gammaproteobacteria bacterium]|nr:hypothetical protein [Gammaproteobacteria bacterium]